MTETTACNRQNPSRSSPPAPASGWPRTCRPSTRTTRPTPTAARKLHGCGPANSRRKLWDGGFAGICFPREYGGLGLPIEYQRAFDIESRNYEMPIILNTPTFTICAATILDMGSEEQKRTHIGGALRGDEVLVQLLSEPSGGSDLAGVITRAERHGDTWVINGAKTWSTSAFAADYGLMLARTNWDVPKHEGLTMFLVPINAPGITLRRIKQVNGSVEFCEEFFDGLELGDDTRGRRGQRRLGRRLPPALPRAPRGGRRLGVLQRHRRRGQDRQADRLRRAPGSGSARPTTSGCRSWPAARWCTAPCRSNWSITSITASTTAPCRRRRAPSSASRTRRTSTSSSTPPWRSPAAPGWSTPVTTSCSPSGSATCPARPPRWAAAPPRWGAT